MRKFIFILIFCILTIFSNSQNQTFITFASPKFKVGDTLLNIQGNALIKDEILYLTQAKNNQVGSTFFKKKIYQINGFSTYFEFQFTNQGATSLAKGADGITFTISSTSNKYGDIGQGIGYQGILNSVSVEFDSFSNSNDPWEIAQTHLSLNIDGNDVVKNKPLVYRDLDGIFDFNKTNIFYTWIDYNKETNEMEIRLNNVKSRPTSPTMSKIIDVTQYATNEFFVGFTSATGGSYEDHKILKWYFSAYIKGGINPDSLGTTDNTPPSKPILDASCNSVWLFGATDSGSGIDHYEYKIDKGLWTIGNNVIFDNTTSHKIYGKSIDKAGNISTVDSVFVSGITHITSNPTSQNKIVGDNISFSVLANNSTSYQWLKDTSILSGKTSNTLSLNNIQLSDTGSYRCIAINSCSQDTSKPAILRIISKPIILTQLLDDTICGGEKLVIKPHSIYAASYQWYKDDMAIGNHTDSLVINSFNQSDCATYTFEAVNKYGSSKTSCSLSMYSGALQITVQPKDEIKCEGEMLELKISSKNAEKFQWKKNNISIENATDSIYFINKVNVSDSGSYSCELSNKCTYIASKEAKITINGKTAILNTLKDTTISEGENVTLKLETNNANSFQWSKNGKDLTNTSNVLSIQNAQICDSGIYCCQAFGMCNNLKSQCKLKVATMPKSQYFIYSVCEGDSITLKTNINCDSYQWFKSGELIKGANSKNLKITKISKNEGSYYCKMEISKKEFIYDYSFNVSPLPETTFISSDFIAYVDQKASFKVEATNVDRFQWLRNGVMINGATKSTYEIESLIIDDGGNYSCLLTNACGTIESKACKLSVAIKKPVITTCLNSILGCECDSAKFCVDYTDGDSCIWLKNGEIFSTKNSKILKLYNLSKDDEGNYSCIIFGKYTYIISNPARLTINLKPKIISEPISYVKTIGDNVTLKVDAINIKKCEWKKDGTVIKNCNNPELCLKKLQLSDNGIYRCILSSDCGNLYASISLKIIEAPRIIANPSSCIKCVGDSAKISVRTNNAKSFQWKKNGQIIENANDSILTIKNITDTCKGYYSCVVSADFINEESSSSCLKVMNKPVIVKNPQDYETKKGVPINLKAGAFGESLNFQWLKDGIIINKANDSLYQFNANSFNVGKYKCKVANQCASYDTKEATIKLQQNIIEAYPNPTNQDYVMLYNYNYIIYEISLYDDKGTLISSEKVSFDFEYKLSLHNVPNGIYFIKILTDEGYITKKIIRLYS